MIQEELINKINNDIFAECAKIRYKYDKKLLIFCRKLLLKYRKEKQFMKFMVAYIQSLEEDIQKFESKGVKSERNKTIKRISFSARANTFRESR